MDRGCERNSQESLGRCTARIFIIKTKRHSRRAACIIINLSSRPLRPAPCAPLRHPARSIVNCGHSRTREKQKQANSLAPFPLIYSRVPDALLLDAGHFLRPSINLPEKKYQDDVDDERIHCRQGATLMVALPSTHSLFVCCVCCMRM
jgi:hypothetical protein